MLSFREHHSRIEKLRQVNECPITEKCFDTGVALLSFIFFTESMCSYILDLNASSEKNEQKIPASDETTYHIVKMQLCKLNISENANST